MSINSCQTHTHTFTNIHTHAWCWRWDKNTWPHPNELCTVITKGYHKSFWIVCGVFTHMCLWRLWSDVLVHVCECHSVCVCVCALPTVCTVGADDTCIIYLDVQLKIQWVSLMSARGHRSKWQYSSGMCVRVCLCVCLPIFACVSVCAHGCLCMCVRECRCAYVYVLRACPSMCLCCVCETCACACPCIFMCLCPSVCEPACKQGILSRAMSQPGIHLKLTVLGRGGGGK